jgi:hypothetical protein
MGAFFIYMDDQKIEGGLFPFASLMPRPGQQLSVLVSAHLFPSLFNNAAQLITSSPFIIEGIRITLFNINCPLFFSFSFSCDGNWLRA